MIKVERQKYSWTCQRRLPVITKAPWSPLPGGEEYFIREQDFEWLQLRFKLLNAIRGRWGNDDAVLDLASAWCSGATVADLERCLAQVSVAKSVAELLASSP